MLSYVLVGKIENGTTTIYGDISFETVGGFPSRKMVNDEILRNCTGFVPADNSVTILNVHEFDHKEDFMDWRSEQQPGGTIDEVHTKQMSELYEKYNVPYRELFTMPTMTDPVWEHDERACEALLEYKNWADYMDATGRTFQVKFSDMQAIAARHGTTTDAMKKHYDCHVTTKDKQKLNEFRERHEQKQGRIDQIAKKI